MKSFIDIVLDEFSTNDEIQLAEGLYTTTPFLAYTAFKRKFFNSIKNSVTYVPKKVSKKARDIKAGVEKEKETLRARVGKTTGETVYKLTKEQIDFLAEVQDKYGSKLIRELLKYRRNVIAPYQLIKRNVKKSSIIS